ncbi:MAG: GNAT family N-acetyltransferase [Epsilonproteobacteria bacterium]|nr:GNAT family N-acetyltransferase [Campylobacterota bacterium]
MRQPSFFHRLSRTQKIILLALICIVIVTIPASKKIYNWGRGLYQTQASLEKIPEEVKGSVISLKNLKPEHFIDMHNVFSRTVRQGLEFPETINLAYSIEYFQHQLNRQKNGELIVYAIVDNKDNKIIGSINIRELNDDDPGQMGCWINEQYWGGGRIQEAIDLCSRIYFRLKKEKSYTAHVRLWNKRSYHALKKAGFVETGYFYENGTPTRYILELKNPYL